MTELEMFTKLPHLDGSKKKDPEGLYDPVLKKTDGAFYLSYECYGFDSIYMVKGNTPEEAIRKAYEWCKNNNLID